MRSAGGGRKHVETEAEAERTQGKRAEGKVKMRERGGRTEGKAMREKGLAVIMIMVTQIACQLEMEKIKLQLKNKGWVTIIFLYDSLLSC